MIPSAVGANLNDTNLEFAEFVLHLGKFLVRFDAAGELAQLVTENIIQQGEPIGDAHRTIASGRIAMMQSRSNENRVGITRVKALKQGLRMTHCFEGRPALQGMAHLFALRAETSWSHDHQGKPAGQPNRRSRDR